MNTVISNQLISFDFFDNFDKAESGLPRVEPDIEMFFLHGWRSQKEAWTGLTNNLLESEIFDSTDSENPKKLKIRLWRLDLPGFGASSTPKNPWKVDNYADLAAIFIKQKGSSQSKKVLIGHSFGGRISIKLAARSGKSISNNLDSSESYKTQSDPAETLLSSSANQESNSKNLPAQIDQLILIGSAGFADNSASLKIKKTLAKIVKPLFQPQFMQSFKQKIYQGLGSGDYLERNDLIETFKLVIDEDLSQNMRQITVPTLLIYGDKDTETPPSFGQRMHDLISNSHLEIVPNAGHFAFVDEPKIVADLIDNFLKKLIKF